MFYRGTRAFDSAVGWEKLVGTILCKVIHGSWLAFVTIEYTYIIYIIKLTFREINKLLVTSAREFFTFFKTEDHKCACV